MRVAAVNAFGAGPARTAAPTQVPQHAEAPDVSVGVNPGDADSLTISFGEAGSTTRASRGAAARRTPRTRSTTR